MLMEFYARIWSDGQGDGPNAGSLFIVLNEHSTTHTQKLAVLARTMERCTHE